MALQKYRVTYEPSLKRFELRDPSNKLIGSGENGRELGKDAWEMGADEVGYFYNLRLDEDLPLKPRFPKGYL